MPNVLILVPSQVVVLGDTPKDIDCITTMGAAVLPRPRAAFTVEELSEVTWCLVIWPNPDWASAASHSRVGRHVRCPAPEPHSWLGVAGHFGGEHRIHGGTDRAGAGSASSPV